MPSLLQRGWSWLRAPANELAFALRAVLRPSGRPAQLPHEAKTDAFSHLDPVRAHAAAGQAAALVERFDLSALTTRSTKAVWAGNLQHLVGLSQLAAGFDVPHGPDGVVHAVDAGCGDFHYATALQRWLSRHAGPPRPVVLRGIELDGFVPHRDGSRRGGRALAHAAMANTPGSEVHFQAADFTGLRLPEQDVVTAFFPFLSSYPCLRWGAPLSRTRPRRFVQRAVATVRTGGWLLVVNQTAAEFAQLQHLLEGEPVRLLASRSWMCDLVPWHAATHGQVGSLWLRS